MLPSPRTLMNRATALMVVCGMGCLAMTGCSSMPLAQRQTDSVDVRLVQDSYQGPEERAVSRKRWEIRKSQASTGGQTIEGLSEYEAAESLYDAGRYAEAEKAFHKLAKSRRSSHEDLGMKMERWWGVRQTLGYDTYSTFGDPIEEDAMFMKAESQFARQRYAHAQESYGALITRYPSTRHLDKVSRRNFQIAREWLGFQAEIHDNGEVQQASGEAAAGNQADFANTDPFYVPIAPNFTDRTRPTFDTRGRALEALRSIWLHDPTGPLADDALMLSASFHLRTQDFEESARLYKMLREQYPDSPHFRDAFLLGSHVTLASYQGSNYDDTSLGEAIDLKESALRIFPDLTEEERNRLGSELDLMYQAEVARIWDRVEFFQAKNAPQSVAVYCKILINRFPDSEYAERARKILQHQQNRRAAFQQAQSQTAAAAEEAPTRAPRLFPGLRWPSQAVPAPEETQSTESPAAESDAPGSATLE
ncbi:MAG: hypothetical protein DWH91_13575 [Planctomycetota bacterium]|nr:MAG: hypothetical protein DWH91_13575 [Planctomycetota bacterium]